MGRAKERVRCVASTEKLGLGTCGNVKRFTWISYEVRIAQSRDDIAMSRDELAKKRDRQNYVKGCCC
jgi:hypothetical protein